MHAPGPVYDKIHSVEEITWNNHRPIRNNSIPRSFLDSALKIYIKHVLIWNWNLERNAERRTQHQVDSSDSTHQTHTVYAFTSTSLSHKSLWVIGCHTEDFAIRRRAHWRALEGSTCRPPIFLGLHSQISNGSRRWFGLRLRKKVWVWNIEYLSNSEPCRQFTI